MVEVLLTTGLIIVNVKRVPIRCPLMEHLPCRGIRDANHTTIKIDTDRPSANLILHIDLSELLGAIDQVSEFSQRLVFVEIAACKIKMLKLGQRG